MRNITELTESLIENYEKMKDETMPMKMGKELANTAGKILNSLRLKLEYNKILEIKDKIPFLD